MIEDCGMEMKSVLISIQPYWVFLIIAEKMGWRIDKKKTIEVRKNYPKDENWDKVAKIYCSKDKKSFAKIPKEYQPLMEWFLGKVIGEFVCDKMLESFLNNNDGWFIEKGCLTQKEIEEYQGEKAILYGWHISNLVIYDKPKELTWFIVPSKIGCCNEGKCKGCKYLDRGNGFNLEDDCNAKFNTDEYKPLRKPPQSWCYVESEK